MAASEHLPPSVARARFAAWVKRTLDAARDRGMKDKDIHEATGVGPSTFHRWRRGEGGKELPELERVKAFAGGLGASVDEALRALGASDARTVTPVTPLPKEVRTILRALADPNVSDSAKLVIREMLTMLEDRATAASRGRTRRGSDEAAS